MGNIAFFWNGAEKLQLFIFTQKQHSPLACRERYNFPVIAIETKCYQQRPLNIPEHYVWFLSCKVKFSIVFSMDDCIPKHAMICCQSFNDCISRKCLRLLTTPLTTVCYPQDSGRVRIFVGGAWLLGRPLQEIDR